MKIDLQQKLFREYQTIVKSTSEIQESVALAIMVTGFQIVDFDLYILPILMKEHLPYNTNRLHVKEVTKLGHVFDYKDCQIYQYNNASNSIIEIYNKKLPIRRAFSNRSTGIYLVSNESYKYIHFILDYLTDKGVDYCRALGCSWNINDGLIIDNVLLWSLHNVNTYNKNIFDNICNEILLSRL